MTGRPKLRVAGEHATDIRLWHTSTYLLQIGTSLEKGYFHPLLAASVFAFFAFEAYLNEVGRQLFPEVWKRERQLFTKGTYRGTLGKFKYLARKSGYRYSEATRPFRTVEHLVAVRDHLAHGRPETYDRKVSATRAESTGTNPKLMAWGQRSFADRAVTDVERLADGLMAAAKLKYGEAAVGFRSSAFVGVSSVGSISQED